MTKDAEINSPGKKASPHVVRPGFDEFLNAIIVARQASNSPFDKDSQTIITLFRKGYEEPLEGWHIVEIGKHLADWDGLPVLGVRLSLMGLLKKHKLIDPIRAQIRQILAIKISYPDGLGVSDPEALSKLRVWMDETPAEKWADWNFCQSFFACILEPGGGVDMILICIEALSLTPKLHAGRFLREASLVKGAYAKLRPLMIGKRHPGPRALALELIRRLVRLQSSKMQLYEESQAEKIASLYEALASCRKKADGLAEEVVEEKAKVTELESVNNALRSEINLLEERISREKERYKQLEDHWGKESDSRVHTELGKLKRRIFHEAREADFALDSNNPDPSMALSRIRHIEELTGEGKT